MGLAFLAATFAGCAGGATYRDVEVPPPVMRSYLHDKPPRLRPLYARVLRGGGRNLVLNQLQAGLAALEMGEYTLAEESFDKALAGIEVVYANNPQAAKARSLWCEEGMKDFKGEPYERSMAYFYRGLLYLRRGDFENARACFKSGVLQDTFAEESQRRCDFALLIFLEGWCSQCLGDKSLTRAAYAEVKRLRPDFSLPAPEHSTLIIAETGTAPRKVSDGVGHYQLKFRRGKHFSESRVRILVGERGYDAFPMEDIFRQASTRGGRPIDKILEGKVVFRKQHERMATTLTDVSSTAMLAAPAFENATSDIQAASAALGLIGVAQIAAASRARPEADTRYWRNLPDTIHVLTCRSASEQSVQAQFLDDGGRELRELRRYTRTKASGRRHAFAWLRSRSAVLKSP